MLSPVLRNSLPAILLLALSPAFGESGTDGIALTVNHSTTPGELTLSWSGGAQPFLLFRSQDPAAVVTADTRIGSVTGPSVALPQGATPIDYFLLVNVDPQSAVSTSSACLTAGTGASSAVTVELQDSLGNPLPGSEVILSTDQGAFGPVGAEGGSYTALLTAPLAASGSATVSITADGVLLGASTPITIEPPLTGSGGGAGGCPADGNLRVRVVDEEGLPILGAHVMVGEQEMPAFLRTSPGGAADGSNTGITDPDGSIELLDFGDNLDGPLTVTAAAPGRRYLTLVDVDAADLLLPLAPIDPPVATGIYSGQITNVPAPSNDPIEVAFTLPDVVIEQILSFSADELLADDECYSAGGVAGDTPLPGNAYIPAQCALQIFICLQSLPEHPYTSAPIPYGDRRLLALRASAPLAALTAGDFGQVLGALTIDGIGVVDESVTEAGPTPLDIPITTSLTPNLGCMIDHAPLNSDVFCVGAGDWDSALDPELPPGAGRLLITGFRLGDAAGTTGPFTIGGVTTVVDSGDFAGIDYLGAAVAQYNDPLKSGIPPGTVDGTSAILDRSGNGFDGSGGTLIFDDFLPVRTLSRSGRDFTLSSLPGATHPPPQLTRVSLERRISESYTACVADDTTRSRRTSYWEIYLPGAASSWRLPTPPVGWPRQDAGGDLAGLIDPAVTPEADELQYVGTTFHLGTLSGFNYDRLRLADVRLHLTHVTRNQVPY